MPRPNVGASLPTLVATEHDLHIVYIADERDPSFDGTSTRMLTNGSDDLPLVHVRFDGPYCHLFGPPNDEALCGHPLAARGLQSCAVQQVIPSGWVHELELRNSVHPYHWPQAFAELHHFILSFHDTMLECVARGFTTTTRRGSVASALRQLAIAASRGAV